MKAIKKIYLGVMLLFLYAPIIVLIVYSFNDSKSRGVFTKLSFRWYAEMIHDEALMRALFITVSIAVISSIAATILGTAATLGINAMKRRTRKAMMALNNVHIIIPDIVMGISLMVLFVFFFRTFGMGAKGFVTLLLAHITFSIPYVILSVMPKVRQLDKSMNEAAQDLGATPSYAFVKVVLPQLMPAVMSGFLLAFTLSLDDFVVSYFTKGIGTPNLSVLIYTYASKRGVSPVINAVSTVMFTVVILLLFVIDRRDAMTINKKTRRERM